MGALQLFLARRLLRAMQATTAYLPEIQSCPAETRPLGAVGLAGGTAQWRWLRRVTGSQAGCLLGQGDILPRAMRTKGNN